MMCVYVNTPCVMKYCGVTFSFFTYKDYNSKNVLSSSKTFQDGRKLIQPVSSTRIVKETRYGENLGAFYVRKEFPDEFCV